jgi:hypothetical protein
MDYHPIRRVVSSWLMLICCERKTLLNSWLTSEQGVVYGGRTKSRHTVIRIRISRDDRRQHKKT